MSSWPNDLARASLVALAVTLLAFISGTYVGVRNLTFCETGNATYFASPNGQNRLVVYSFDCGATDRSFEVSMLKAAEALPRHQSAVLLYSAPGTPRPTGASQNFDVSWTSPQSVTVRIDGLADEKAGDQLAFAGENVHVELKRRR